MSKNLLIVESPAKANTLKKYLGENWSILASYGHIRDLVPKEGAIDTENFSMKYEVVKRNAKHLDAIKKSMKTHDSLYLATDPDREGEAISWHIYEALNEKKLLHKKNVHRVVFHEITKNAIQDAVKNPRKLSMDLVNAQQARRALDFLVGFNLSPLLWRKVQRGLSAGRVQSPALRLIVEREQEIEKFKAKEYWTIEAYLNKADKKFKALLSVLDQKKVKQFDIQNEKQANEITHTLKTAANGELIVHKIERKKQNRRPMPPFTTSTLQQEASRKLGFRAQKTMRVAQQLYEGIEVGAESIGLITYMRTDSFTLSNEALGEIRAQIKNLFGEQNVPPKPNFYKTKSKNAQEAHEAIRPTSAMRHPNEIKQYLSDDQFKLYSIIWKRTLACQMIPATINTIATDLSCGAGALFRATGSSIANPGFYSVYHESDEDNKTDIEEKWLPDLKEGEAVLLKEMIPEQHFTKAPPRYTEASLVKSLEAYGIGRPSTYASIITTLLDRNYAELEKRRFVPTDVGRVVNRFLTDHFTQYVDFEFTAHLEDDLDAVSRGEQDWKPLMGDFWKSFKQKVDEKSEVSRGEVTQGRELGVDPKSGRPVSVRLGRYGPMAQIGTREDEEKPKFAGIPKGKSIETITLDEVLELFKLPRILGETKDGEAVSTNIGRFGPYVKYANKFVSLKDEDPYTVTLETALRLIEEKKIADANKTIKTFDDSDIEILNGRYGPYIKSGRTNAKIPKDKEPKDLTLEECQVLITEAKNKPKRRGRKKS
jgi:DNA topoisomerase-1